MARCDDGGWPGGEARLVAEVPESSGAGMHWAAHRAAGVEPRGQQPDELAGRDRAAHGAAGAVSPRQSADERAGGDRAARVA